GRRDTAYNQPIGARENGVEMNSSRLYAAQQIFLRYRAEYEAVFGKIPIPLDDAARFPPMTGKSTGCQKLENGAYGIQKGLDCHGMPGDGAEFDHLQSDQDKDEVTRIAVNMGKAINAYERLLTCGQGRFDKWMRDPTGQALTVNEQRGAALF